MGQDVHGGVPHGLEDALRLLRRRQVEARVDRHQHHVQLGQHLVFQVQLPAGQDVHLHAAQDPDLRMTLLDLVYLLPLLPQLRRVQPAGHGQRLAVVGHGEVLVAARHTALEHLLDGLFAVGPGGVHLEVAADVLERDELRQLPGERRLDLTPVLAQLRSDPGQPHGLVHVCFLPSRHQLAALSPALTNPDDAVL